MLADPCDEEGEERPCRNTCGEGVEVCEAGFYGECSVLPTRRTCENACGSGTQTCSDDSWGDCEVPPSTRSCANECGNGTQACEDGAWGDCEVPRSERACTGTCGEGTQACEDGAWGGCQVPPTEAPCSNLCGTGVQRCENGVFGVCEVPVVERNCRSVCGPGHERCIDGSFQPCDAPLPKPPDLRTTIRDFRVDHPDFEITVPPGYPNIDLGIVGEYLDGDDKPIYVGNPNTGTTPSTTGASNFYHWYHDVPGVNAAEALDLQLGVSAQDPRLFVYLNTSFFPIDGRLFMNEGNQHNYHFTLEAKTTFEYVGGETFSFTGDDDMWVFINRRLAIDLGGLHRPRSASVALDTIAGSHGLVPGGIYPLHFFFAERHTFESNFSIETSIADPGSCE